MKTTTQQQREESGGGGGGGSPKKSSSSSSSCSEEDEETSSEDAVSVHASMLSSEIAQRVHPNVDFFEGHLQQVKERAELTIAKLEELKLFLRLKEKKKKNASTTNNNKEEEEDEEAIAAQNVVQALDTRRAEALKLCGDGSYSDGDSTAWQGGEAVSEPSPEGGSTLTLWHSAELLAKIDEREGFEREAVLLLGKAKAGFAASTLWWHRDSIRTFCEHARCTFASLC